MQKRRLVHAGEGRRDRLPHAPDLVMGGDDASQVSAARAFCCMSVCPSGIASTRMGRCLPSVTKLCFRAPTDSHGGHGFFFHSKGIP